MTLDTKTAGQGVRFGTDYNQIVAHINNAANRIIITSNTTFVVPDGMHNFLVYLCGGGGPGGDASGGDIVIPGATGGVSPLISAVFSAIDVGSSIAVVIGAGGTGSGSGGTSSFGATMSVTGGGHAVDATPGSNGAATFPSGAPHIYHSNGLWLPSSLLPYGSGGAGNPVSSGGDNGIQGVCVILY